MPIVWVTLVGLAVNIGTALMFVGGRKDLNIRGAFLHMTADAAVTFGVLLAGLGIHFTGALWLDPAISLAIVAAILWSTWGLFRDSLQLSLDAVPAGIDPAAVRESLAGLPGVAEVHDLHIWAMSTTRTALTAHLVLTEARIPSQPLIDQACRTLHDLFEIEHTTLQIEPPEGVGCRQRPPETL